MWTKQLFFALVFTLILVVSMTPSGHNRVLRLLPDASVANAHRAVIVFELAKQESGHIDFHYTRYAENEQLPIIYSVVLVNLSRLTRSPRKIWRVGSGENQGKLQRTFEP